MINAKKVIFICCALLAQQMALNIYPAENNLSHADQQATKPANNLCQTIQNTCTQLNERYWEEIMSFFGYSQINRQRVAKIIKKHVAQNNINYPLVHYVQTLEQAIKDLTSYQGMLDTQKRDTLAQICELEEQLTIILDIARSLKEYKQELKAQASECEDTDQQNNSFWDDQTDHHHWHDDHADNTTESSSKTTIQTPSDTEHRNNRVWEHCFNSFNLFE